MKIKAEINLEVNPDECSNPPIIRLAQMLDDLKPGEAIKVKYGKDKATLKAVKLLALKRSLNLQVEKEYCIVSRD